MAHSKRVLQEKIGGYLSNFLLILRFPIGIGLSPLFLLGRSSWDPETSLSFLVPSCRRSSGGGESLLCISRQLVHGLDYDFSEYWASWGLTCLAGKQTHLHSLRVNLVILPRKLCPKFQGHTRKSRVKLLAFVGRNLLSISIVLILIVVVGTGYILPYFSILLSYAVSPSNSCADFCGEPGTS